jgi:hypothetical protein
MQRLLASLTPAEHELVQRDIAARKARGERWTMSKALKRIVKLRDMAARGVDGLGRPVAGAQAKTPH